MEAGDGDTGIVWACRTAALDTAQAAELAGRVGQLLGDQLNRDGWRVSWIRASRDACNESRAGELQTTRGSTTER
jgi:hypothetical protein